MEECNICYENMVHKVILECKHELCVRCFLQLKPFKCHMCRKKYDFTARNVHESNKSSFEIQEEENPLSALILNEYPGEKCSCYKVSINNKILNYIILYTQQIEDYEIRSIISDHVNCYPNMQRDIENPYLFTMNVNFYIQDYYDVILKRVLRA